MNAAALFVQSPQMLCTGVSGAEENFGHSKLSVIMAHLQYEFVNYKYTVYRCASKLVTLQKNFYTTNIPYKLLLAVLERHGLREAEASLMVPPFQLASLIHDIYFACEKLGHFTKYSSFKLEVVTAILTNFFWNIFDPNRRHSVSLLEIKATFLLLCKMQTSEILEEFYKLVCDAKNKCVSKLNFQQLLNTLTKVITYIGEGAAYGAHNSQIVMEQCFARCHNTSGLTEHQFHCLWTTTQTRFLIYANLVALVKRLEDTEKLVHNNECACCRSEKIIGIRFKCQACNNLSLCLKCFAIGYSTNKHEAGHRMFEIYTEDAPPKKFRHYFTKLCNLLLFTSESSEEETKSFCHSNETTIGNDSELIKIEMNRPSGAVVNGVEVKAAITALIIRESGQHTSLGAKPLLKVEPSLAGLTDTAKKATNVSGHLQYIINRLLQQNIKLEHQLKIVQTATNEEISDFLCSHRQFLIEIINEMRKFSANKIPSYSECYPNSSTPNRAVLMQQAVILDSFGTAIGDSNLSRSINGADINRSYLDANKSDYSLNDLSVWFNNQPRRMSLPAQSLSVLKEVSRSDGDEAVDMRDTEMKNFKLLLNKVKEIIDDSYSDNSELAAATQNLENVLDGIIKNEESRRRST